MLMDHLGSASRISGPPIPRDISGMATGTPPRLASVVLCVPSTSRSRAPPFTEIADRVLMISGERGPAAEATERAAARLPSPSVPSHRILGSR